MRNFRKPLLIAMCVASMGAASLPLSTSAAVTVFFNAAPPPARVEVAPAVGGEGTLHDLDVLLRHCPGSIPRRTTAFHAKRQL